MNEQFLFVYNANSGLFSTVTDFAHKLLSPATYSCSLCALTYGHFSIKQEWKDFIENLPVKTTFIYKDEFEKQYKIKTGLPSVFVNKKGILKEIISKPEIESCTSLTALKALVKQKIEGHVQYYHPNL